MAVNSRKAPEGEVYLCSFCHRIVAAEVIQSPIGPILVPVPHADGEHEQCRGTDAEIIHGWGATPSDSRSKPDRAETENTGSVHESGGAKQSPKPNLNNPLPPVGLDELERARELLAERYERERMPRWASRIRHEPLLELEDHLQIAIKAIVAALQSPLSVEGDSGWASPGSCPSGHAADGVDGASRCDPAQGAGE